MYVSVEFDSIEISPITGFRDDLMDSVIVKSQLAKRQWSVDYSLGQFRKYDFDVDWSTLSDYFSPVNESAEH